MTARRDFFTAMAGAVVGGTVVPGVARAEANPDAELLAACEAFRAAHAVYWGPDAGDEIMLAADKPGTGALSGWLIFGR